MRFFNAAVLVIGLIYCTMDLGQAAPGDADVEEWCRHTGCPTSTISLRAEFDEELAEWVCHCKDQSDLTRDVTYRSGRTSQKSKHMYAIGAKPLGIEAPIVEEIIGNGWRNVVKRIFG